MHRNTALLSWICANLGSANLGTGELQETRLAVHWQRIAPLRRRRRPRGKSQRGISWMPKPRKAGGVPTRHVTCGRFSASFGLCSPLVLSLIHISEPTRPRLI
eukprot:3793205-Amphidinium_carterae.1